MIPVARAQVVHARVRYRGVDPDAQGDEMLEQSAEKRAPAQVGCAALSAAGQAGGVDTQEPGRKRRVSELMLGRLPQPREVVARRQPRVDLVEEPEALEHLA